jgi:peptide chain release factor 1
MIERLEIIKNRYEELNKMLLDPSVLSDVKKTMELSKEAKDLEEPVKAYERLVKINDDMEAAKEMSKDPDMGEFAKEELENLAAEKEKLERDIEIMLIPKDPNDGKNVIIEIRGAAGGDEANIFAGDLYRMYLRYAEKVGWKIEPIEEEYSEGGGYSLVSFMIKGDNVYSKMKYESGAHRVQRVPVTETQGRIHTSTATVLVMPEAEDLDFELDMSEVRIDITRSSGAGGQGVNTTDSAVRATHIPTGTIVYCQVGRSQTQNKEMALRTLKARLYDMKQREKEEKEGAERRSKIGTGDRSEKIRTYNYPQNRVTDHRIGFTVMNLDRVMEGDLDAILEALITEDQRRILAGEE